MQKLLTILYLLLSLNAFSQVANNEAFGSTKMNLIRSADTLPTTIGPHNTAIGGCFGCISDGPHNSAFGTKKLNHNIQGNAAFQIKGDSLFINDLNAIHHIVINGKTFDIGITISENNGWSIIGTGPSFDSDEPDLVFKRKNVTVGKIAKN